MGFYILVASSYYALHFCPEIYGYGLAGFALLFSISFFLKERFSCIAIAASLVYLLLSASVSSSVLSLGYDKSIKAIVAEVISEPSARANRKIGYRAELLAVIDDDGSVFQAKGCIYVISKYADVHYGDKLILSGYFSDSIFSASSSDFYVKNVLGRLRIFISSRIMDMFRGGAAGQLASLLLLGRAESEAGLSELARKAGLSHVIALSGMHLAIISAFFSKLLFFIKNEKIRNTLSYIPLVFFAYLSGWRPSLMRALIFRVVIDNMPDDAAFILSDCILLILFPLYALDLGTIYSFIALSGILIFSMRIDDVLQLFHVPMMVSSSVSASACAMIFSIPITYSLFGSYQMSAIITAIPMTLLISLYMHLSIAALVFPFMNKILEPLYIAIEFVFRQGSACVECHTVYPLLIMILAVALLYLISLYYFRDWK